MASTAMLMLLALATLTPFLTAYTLRLSLQLVGWTLRRKTHGRRELIIERVDAEERAWRHRRKNTYKNEDDDWEKVEGCGVGTTPNGDAAGADWEGIIGFFHPFWYVPSH